jgi:ethanolamine ammonia-lyase large subunit
MLSYQSLAYHDILGLRHQFGLRPAPEFDAWLERMGMLDEGRRVAPLSLDSPPLRLLSGG